MKARAKRGFTLIELLVVIAIIGILASIITVSLSSARAKSRDARRQADIKNIQLALAQYFNDNGMYPKNIYGTGASAPDKGLAPTYLPVVPRDPNATASCSNSSGDSCYKYMAYSVSSTNCTATNNQPIYYHLGAPLEDTGSGALSQDVDAGASISGYTACTFGNPSGLSSAFDGNGTSCTANTASTPDPCYDMVP